MFYNYPYPLLKPLLEEEHIKLASAIDIGCMKLSAIVSRATLKDYVDLYFILQSISLKKLLEENKKKHSTLETNLVLKGLIYFDDVSIDPIDFMSDRAVSFDHIKKFLIHKVKKYFHRHT